MRESSGTVATADLRMCGREQDTRVGAGEHSCVEEYLRFPHNSSIYKTTVGKFGLNRGKQAVKVEPVCPLQ